VVFGAVVSGRPFELDGVETMVGLFINTIPIRIRFNGNTKFNELLRLVRENAIACEPHHYYPLAEIQADTALKQDLIDNLFIFENYPVAEQIEGQGNKNDQTGQAQFRLSGVDVFEQTNYDFNVIFAVGDELYGAFQYNSHVYNRDLVERITGGRINTFVKRRKRPALI
jgi:non-ribosomal peptide synthetase component F